MKTCHATQKPSKDEEKSEINELKDIVRQLNEKIDQMQKQKETEGQNHYSQFKYGIAGRRYYQGFNSRFRMNRGRGRGDFRPSRPVGTTTFRGSCYICNERGHMAKDCLKDLSDVKSDKNLKG